MSIKSVALQKTSCYNRKVCSWASAQLRAILKQKGENMTIKSIAKVTSEGKLEIPTEILQQLQPLTEYEISVTDQEIILKKQSNVTVDLDLFLQELDQLEADPEQPTLEEISAIVNEVRQELWGK